MSRAVGALLFSLATWATALEREPVAVLISSPVYPKEAVLLGGWQNGQWLNAANTSLTLKAKAYRWQHFDGSEGSVETDLPRMLSRASCEATLGLPALRGAVGQGSRLYTNAPWPLQPRPIELLEPKDYQQWVLDYLQQKGLSPKNSALVRALRLDLDGDGATEVLLEARFFADGGVGGKAPKVAQPGDYSVILLRSTDQKTAITLPLLESYGPKQKWQVGDKQEKPVAFAYELAGVADLNGDGVMEIAVYEDYAEGELFSVYSGRPKKGFELVLYEGCWD